MRLYSSSRYLSYDTINATITNHEDEQSSYSDFPLINDTKDALIEAIPL